MSVWLLLSFQFQINKVGIGQVMKFDIQGSLKILDHNIRALFQQTAFLFSVLFVRAVLSLIIIIYVNWMKNWLYRTDGGTDSWIYDYR